MTRIAEAMFGVLEPADVDAALLRIQGRSEGILSEQQRLLQDQLDDLNSAQGVTLQGLQGTPAARRAELIIWVATTSSLQEQMRFALHLVASWSTPHANRRGACRRSHSEPNSTGSRRSRRSQVFFHRHAEMLRTGMAAVVLPGER